MKFPWLLCLFLFACDGTEVGNGVTAPETSGATDKAASEPAKTIEAPTASTSEMSSPSLSFTWLVARCASPLVDIQSGTYASAAGEVLKIVREGPTGRRLSTGSQSFLVTPRPTSEVSFAVEVAPAVPTGSSCSAVTGKLLPDGQTQRSVLIDGLMTVRWTLDASGVKTMEIEELSSKASVRYLRVD